MAKVQRSVASHASGTDDRGFKSHKQIGVFLEKQILRTKFLHKKGSVWCEKCLIFAHIWAKIFF
jgi:hypothetical protein